MTRATSPWDELVTTALLGTDRRSLPDGLPAAVTGLASAQDDRGLAVLDAAAGYTTYLRAGDVPAPCPPPAAAPRQVLDLAPEPAQALLAGLLRRREAGLVNEWLATCAERGLGVRAGVWSALVSAAVATTAIDRELTRRTLGDRGLAFATAHPRWRALTRAPATRSAPAAHTPDQLDRLTERALRAVRVTGAPGRRRVIVEPPVLDDGLTADGINPGPPRASDVGREAHLLRQVVAAAHLDAWQADTGLPPEPLLDLLHHGAAPWYAHLCEALAEAAVRQRDAGWATALTAAGHATPELLDLLAPGDLVAIVDARVRAGTHPDQVSHLLVQVPAPWPDGVARVALGLLGSGRLGAASSRRLARAAAHRLPLAAHEVLSGLADREQEALLDGETTAVPHRGFVEAADILAARVALHAAFDPDRPAPADRPETPHDQESP